MGKRLKGLTIVNAAKALARHLDEPVVRTATVLRWFDDYGYRSLQGAKPTRGSVYAALYGAVRDGSVTQPQRGRFDLLPTG